MLATNEPSAVAPSPSCTVPAETVITPVKSWLPVTVHVPVPILVTLPLSEMTPEKAVEELLPPTVSVAEPRLTEPAPESEATAWETSSRLNVAPAATVTALVAGSEPGPACGRPRSLAAWVCSMPAETKVVPA